jgi:hypothetical protein
MPSDVIDFTGDWGDHLPVMEEAAEDNELYHVVLTRKEYERLDEGGLVTLKTRCSALLANKLYLAEDYLGQGDILIVLRYGSCP